MSALVLLILSDFRFITLFYQEDFHGIILRFMLNFVIMMCYENLTKLQEVYSLCAVDTIHDSIMYHDQQCGKIILGREQKCFFIFVEIIIEICAEEQQR